MSNKFEATFHPGRSAEWHAAIQAATMAVFDFATTAPGVKLIGCTPSMIAQVAASAALAASPAPEVLGYTVMLVEDGWREVSEVFNFQLDAERSRKLEQERHESSPFAEDSTATYRVVQLVGVRGEGK